MPDRMSDAEVLGQTAEWLSRLADTIERATAGLADSIAQVRAEQGELRDAVLESDRRINALVALLELMNEKIVYRTPHDEAEVVRFKQAARDKGFSV